MVQISSPKDGKSSKEHKKAVYDEIFKGKMSQLKEQNIQDNLMKQDELMEQNNLMKVMRETLHTPIDLQKHKYFEPDIYSLGNMLHSVGDHERAVEDYVVGVEKAEVENDVPSQAWTHFNFGNTHYSLDKYELGLCYLQKSLELTKVYEPTPSPISRAHKHLHTAYQALSKLDEAERYYDKALSLSIYGNDLTGQARAYGNIGNLYMLHILWYTRRGRGDHAFVSDDVIMI